MPILKIIGVSYMKKTLVFITLALGAASFSPIYAGEYAANGPDIHQTIVDLGQKQCCAEFNISTKMGHLVNNTCQYEAETPPMVASGCMVSPYGVFKLDGGVLESEIGNKWDCAATHLVTQIGSKEAVSAFKLIKNDQNHFVNSDPTATKVSFPLC
jgi:hypothetical protein